MDPVVLGAVAYDGRVVTIWEGIRAHFLAEGVPMEFVLFGSYERQVEALMAGHIDVAWNTPLAHVRVKRRTGGRSLSLGMRDSDRDFQAKIVVRTDSGIVSLGDLAGAKLAVGSRDSTQARILPLHFLREAGVDLGRVTLVPFDTDVGKHGDTGTSELEVLAALRDARADAGAVGDLVWVAEQAAGRVDPHKIRVLWSTPTFDHCMFDALPGLPSEKLEAFKKALFAMRWENPEHRRLLELEGLRTWMPPREEGYESLLKALEKEGDVSAAALEGGNLPLGGGLLALLRPALDAMQPGGVVALLSSASSLREDLPSWCRASGHVYRGLSDQAGRDVHQVERGPYSVPGGERETGMRLDRPGAGSLLKAVPMPERADPMSGFAPRGAQVEPGGPSYPFTLLDRDRLAPPEVGALYEQAAAAQWTAADIPWNRVGKLPVALEAAVGQVMTFLAENELAALYVPARFLPRIHPAYVEVAMFLATQLADEARHVEVFLARARAGGGGAGISAATTSRSLHALLTTDDFTEASFLLSVLGEGTFLDLLRFIEDHAPDEATAELCKRARADEARHVHFGISHVRQALEHDSKVAGELVAAVERRARTMNAQAIPAPLQDALTVLAAGGTDPRGLARGHAAFRELLESMEERRARRLTSAGFEGEQARRLASLHTPNFM